MGTLVFIGEIHSPLKSIADCPLQENEGAPQVVVAIDEKFRGGMLELNVGDRVILLTWLHKANREILTTKPRNDPNARTAGVFATRSPDRPNPIGMHIADILAISDRGEITISNLEVLDGTPLLDIKPFL